MILTPPRPCRVGFRCLDHRQCEACARIRQAQVADVAEVGAATTPGAAITYAVIRTYAPADIGPDREAFAKKLARRTMGGIWTVETGAISTGLHLNLLAATDQPVTAAQIAKMWPVSSPADVWAAPIARPDVRRVAAYMSKKSGIPPEAEYSGRTYGSWGGWKKPLGSLIDDPQKAPIVAAAALESLLAGAGVPAPATAATTGPATTQEELREKHLARLCAIHRGELEIKTSVYVPGWGLVMRADAERFGMFEKNDR